MCGISRRSARRVGQSSFISDPLVVDWDNSRAKCSTEHEARVFVSMLLNMIKNRFLVDTI